MPATPLTERAETTRPHPAGPSALGTTSVQSSVIVHVTTCAPARLEMLRPSGRPSTVAARPGGEVRGTVIGPRGAGHRGCRRHFVRSDRLLEERERFVQDVMRLGFVAGAD